MKGFIVFLFLVFILNFGAQAQDVASTKARESRSGQEAKVNPLEFFETLVNPNIFHPDNKRDPLWQEENLTQLTLEPMDRNLSPKEFAELLKGTWRILYHCDGRPVMTRREFGDKKSKWGYLEREYDGGIIRVMKLINQDQKSLVLKLIKQIIAFIASEGGKFKITYEDFFADDVVNLVKIKESKTPALLFLSESRLRKSCQNPTDYQSLSVRTDIPTM